jgi:hypothetical protein
MEQTLLKYVKIACYGMEKEDPLISWLQQRGYPLTVVSERSTLLSFNEQMKEVYLVLVKDQVDVYESLEILGLPVLLILSHQPPQPDFPPSRENPLFDFMFLRGDSSDLEELTYRLIRLVEQSRTVSISDEYHFDFLTRTFRHKDRDILTGRGNRLHMAIAVLRMLVRNRGKALSKEAMRQYLGPGAPLLAIINDLRVALQDYDSVYLQKTFIQYSRESGAYTFTGHVLFPQKKALNENIRRLVEEALVKTLRPLPIRRKLKYVLGKLKYILMTDRAGLFCFSREDNRLCQFIGDYRVSQPAKRYDQVEIDLGASNLSSELEALRQYLWEPKNLNSNFYVACEIPQCGADCCIYVGNSGNYEIYLLVDDLTRARTFNPIDLKYCRDILKLRSVQKLLDQLLVQWLAEKG